MTRTPLYLTPMRIPASAGAPGSVNIIRAGALLVALLCVVSCSGQSDAEDAFLPAEFDTRQDLLSGQVLIDSTFFMQAPLAWADLDTGSFNVVREAISNDTAAFFTLEPIRIMSSPAGASCIISKIADNLSVFESLNEDFKGKLKLTSQSENVTKGSFSVGGVRVVQYRVITPDLIAFKLFCLVDTGYYQIDYLLPAGLYEGEIRKVESSIGSITSRRTRKEVAR